MNHSPNHSLKPARKSLLAARKTLLQGLPKDNKAVLHGIKGAFAICWGFCNGLSIFLTRRFFTMMTGNTLILAAQTIRWDTEEMIITASLIILYISGLCLYDGFSLWLDNEDFVIKVFLILIPTCVLLGISADLIQFFTKSCSTGLEECNGQNLYFFLPGALISGIVSSYLAAHPDGIITNIVTG